MKKEFLYSLLLVLFVFLSACSPYKHVSEEQYLLNRATVESNIKKQNKTELQAYLKQNPNFRAFGLFRFRLGIYNLSGKDSTKKINLFLRKIGEDPVIYDETLTENSKVEIKRYFENQGYIPTEVNSTVKFKKKKANVSYQVTAHRPYRINDYTFRIKNDTILAIIEKDSAHMLIKKNMKMDVDVIHAERARIHNLLKKNGYYNFNKESLHFLADSTVGDNKVNLQLVLRRTERVDSEGNISVNVPKQYTVRNVYIFTSYDPIATLNYENLDSITENGVKFYYQEKIHLKPEVFLDNCYIEPNKKYNEEEVEKTYARLNLLSAIRYVNIRFEEIEGSNFLDCIILTSPSKTQSYSLDVEGTNSTGDLGFAGILGYQHKNFFKKSEVFRASFRLANEMRVFSSEAKKYNSTELGTELSLNYPRFLFPLLDRDFKRKIKASTELNLSYNYQKRLEYARTIASGGMKYLWSPHKYIRHSVELWDLSYIYLPYISDEFRRAFLNNNSILKYSYEDHLILRSGYSFSYGAQARKQHQDNVTVRTNIESAGNGLYALYSMFGTKKTGGSYTLMNIKFSQYLKGDFNFSYDKYIDKRNSLVYHLGIGIGIPYGNVNFLPFEKRYVSGGANSVRGWSIRSLGPGTYKGTQNYIDYMNQSGDIKLDCNLEYRFKMFWLIEGALFADVGNIWTIREYETQEGGAFKLKDFYKELAAAYGFGARFDFTYFILRVDMGVKAYDPALVGGEKWRFRSLNWKDDFAFHFAVGYPF